MNEAERACILAVLRERRDVIAERWYRAVAWTGFTSSSAADMRQQLAALTERAIDVLFTEPFERHQAQAIGTALARLHYYIQPETLGRTHELLVSQFGEGLSLEQIALLQPHLAALLGALAVGFFSQARETILAEQEQIRNALLTERKRSMEALQASEERYRWLVERLPDAIGVYSEDRLVFINQAGARLIGATDPDQVIGRPIMEFVHPDSLDLVEEGRRIVEETETELPLIEKKIIRIDGSAVNVEVTAIPFTYQGRPAVQFVAHVAGGRRQGEHERDEPGHKQR